MANQKKWYKETIPCSCPRWKTCKYGAILDWEYERKAVCGYSFMTEDVRGCPISECDKYEPKTKSSNKKGENKYE